MELMVCGVLGIYYILMFVAVKASQKKKKKKKACLDKWEPTVSLLLL